VTFAEHLAELGDYGTGASVIAVFAAGVVPLQLLTWGVGRLLEALR